MSTSNLMSSQNISVSSIELVRFDNVDPGEKNVLYRISGNELWFAIALDAQATNTGIVDLEMMFTESNQRGEGDVWFEAARLWCESKTPGIKATLISLHGIDVYWCAGRAAICAPGDRVEPVRKAIVEFALAERELRSTELAINASWKELENDVPTAYSYREKNIRDREALGKRFQKAVALQAKLSRIIPMIVQPSQYPPTLESQLHERLRERLRQEDRLEVAERQLDVFNRVYEMCSQRSSDFMLARSGHMLEWIIIFLLAIQTIMTIIEYLPNSTTGT